MNRLPFFFYGSLQSPDVLSTVLGRAEDAVAPVPATLAEHRVARVIGEAFPCLVAAPGRSVEGAILGDLTEAEAARIIFFEDEAEFELREVAVATADGPRRARAFFPRDFLKPGEDWSYAAWLRDERPLLLECAVEIMDLYEAGVDWSDLSMWPGIKNRARARARARAENAAREAGDLPAAGAAAAMPQVPSAVEVDRLSRPYASYFGIEEMVVRHELFGGGRSVPLKRAAFVSGDAVTVLPWDPARDEVLLIAQWRAGPQARGDANPWPLEVIAGRLDADEDPEAAARREAREEAALELGAIERVAGSYYPSPGVMAENITSYVAAADLSDAGGVHGLEEEGEDIAAIRMSFDEAMALVDQGAVNSATALVSLLWLARRREALRAAWGG